MCRYTLLTVRQSGKWPSRRHARAMRRSKCASLDDRHNLGTRERRHGMSQCCFERGIRAFAAKPIDHRTIAGRKSPRRYLPKRPAKMLWGFSLRDGTAINRRPSKNARTPLAIALRHTMPTFLRARNASNVERRVLAPPHRSSA